MKTRLKDLLEKIEITSSNDEECLNPISDEMAIKLTFFGGNTLNNGTCSGNGTCWNNDTCSGNSRCSGNSTCTN